MNTIINLRIFSLFLEYLWKFSCYRLGKKLSSRSDLVPSGNL